MSYPINTPVTLVNTTPNDEIDFQADGPSAGLLNKAKNFVTTSAGDMLYRASGGNNYIERLPIGSSNQILTVVGGLPAWSANVTTGSNFTARVTASIAGIPTSRSGGANPGVWFTLNSTYVTWSTAAPANDANTVFNTASGLFTAPANGTYQFSAVISFDHMVGGAAGAGLPAAPLPSGTAVRQAQIYSPTLGGGTELQIVSEQAAPSNSNITAVSISTAGVVLTAGDTVGIRVRHDRSVANVVTIGDVTKAAPGQTYFSGKRIA